MTLSHTPGLRGGGLHDSAGWFIYHMHATEANGIRQGHRLGSLQISGTFLLAHPSGAAI